MCTACIQAKHKQKLIKVKTKRTTKPFELVHLDVGGAFSMPTAAGHYYYCHSSGCKCWIEGYLGIVLGGRKELELRKDEDCEGCGNGVRMLRDGGGIICYDKEVG
jgi:hypothetical protein